MFYDKFLSLCNQQKKSPSIVADELGFSRSSVTKWKNGATLRSANLKRVADYFNVPIEFFSEDTPAETKVSSAAVAEAEDIMKIYGMLTPERQKQARVAIADLLKDQLQE